MFSQNLNNIDFFQSFLVAKNKKTLILFNKMNATVQQTSQTGASHNTVMFATIELADASTKLSLYLQKLSALQQTQLQDNKKKCQKIVRLSFETFLKYCQNEDFSKQSYELARSYVISKRSYYSLYLVDLMIKNCKYIIKTAKKDIQSMIKIVWENIAKQKGNQQKFQNLKVIIRCWSFIYSEKFEESIRKWLESKYSIKKIQLTEENQKAIREIYGQKKQLQTFRSGNSLNDNNNNKINEALLYSLVNDDNVGPSPKSLGSLNQRSGINKNRNAFSPNSFGSFASQNDTKTNQKLQKTPITSISKQSNSSSSALNLNKQQIVNKKIKLQGVNKSLLQALDLQ